MKINKMDKFFISQKEFFKKVDKKKYNFLENNLCGLVNIFIILKNLGCNIKEEEILYEAIKLKTFDSNRGWKYKGLIKILNKFDCYGLKTFIFNIKIFHNLILNSIFKSFKNIIFLASIKLDENHLIIINKIDNTYVYYDSVGTLKEDVVKNGKIKKNIFFEKYNKRGIFIF